MKYPKITAILILFSFLLVGCSETKSSDKYIYSGETIFNLDDRSFILEDIPKSIEEETVVKDFLYTISGDFDLKSNILADIVPHQISIESQKKNLNEGVYIKSFEIHKITTLTKEKYNDKENSLYYYGWEEAVDKYNLSEYEIINVTYSQKFSSKAIELGPQIGDGTYSRSFIVGRRNKKDSYKIYDFGFL